MLEKRIRKPAWLKVQLGNNGNFTHTEKIVRKNNLHTICQSGKCPNMGECWNAGTATFMIAGDVCTRSCKFCNVKTGRPGPLDVGEPLKIANTVKEMKLVHAVITSVDRDDLPDYGAAHWAASILAIKEINPHVTMEALIPDFNGQTHLLDIIIAAHPDIISHNMETVRRLTPKVRSVAKYDVSLAVLKYIYEQGIAAKTGLMVGLGESKEEVVATMHDIIATGCSLLSIGQYLQPSKANIKVEEYVHPDTFAYYKKEALAMGFRHVESGPLVRSSYNSIKFLSS
ncbi:lipoate synthase [Bacteroidales bacterium]|nr:lipoate synthase [Bacteroidales bacterium]